MADHSSLRFGGVHVLWEAWTSNISHVPNIDTVIWQSIQDGHFSTSGAPVSGGPPPLRTG
jgi:hypothetical protein